MVERFIDNEPSPMSSEEFIGQMARERLSEFSRIRAEIGDVSTQITTMELVDNLSSAQTAMLGHLREQRQVLRATGALDPITILTHMAIAEAFNPSSPSVEMFYTQN